MMSWRKSWSSNAIISSSAVRNTANEVYMQRRQDMELPVFMMKRDEVRQNRRGLLVFMTEGVATAIDIDLEMVCWLGGERVDCVF